MALTIVILLFLLEVYYNSVQNTSALYINIQRIRYNHNTTYFFLFRELDLGHFVPTMVQEKTICMRQITLMRLKGIDENPKV